MADPSSEGPNGAEVLEVSDEGKKKSKFKALKSFFGKKKKKEPENAQGGRMLKPSLSSSNIDTPPAKPVPEIPQTEPRPKSSMGTKSLSHDSIFMLESEPRTADKTYPSMELQRGRPLQRFLVSRTLPRTGTSNMQGAVSGAMSEVVRRCVPKSGIWVSGSKITEILPLHPRKPSISPPFKRSDTMGKDLKEISVDDEPPKIPQKKASPHKLLAAKKNLSEPSCGPSHSQSSTACASPCFGFSTPASTQGCLDSSAARHKISLNPRKLRKKKRLQASVKPKQEERSLPLNSEGEKNATKPKEADQRNLKKDSAGPLNQEQSKTEVYDQKTTANQAPTTEAAGNHPVSVACGRRRRKKGLTISGTKENAPKVKSLIQSSQGHGEGSSFESLPAIKTASDCPLGHQPSEKQATRQIATPQAENTTSQQLLSNKSGTGKRNDGIDLETQKASVPQPVPEDKAEAKVSGSPLSHKDGASEAKKLEAKASLLPVVEGLSTTQEEPTPSVAEAAQVLIDPPQTRSGEQEASSLGLENGQSRTELSQDVPTICKEEPPGNVPQATTPSGSDVASTTAQKAKATERLPPSSLCQSPGESEAPEVSSHSQLASEEGRGSERQQAAGSFPPLQKPEDEEDISESESLVEELSSLEQQLDCGIPSQVLENPKAIEVTSDSESITDEGSSSEEEAAELSFQSLVKLETVPSGSKYFVSGSISEEQLAPRFLSQALQEPKDTEVSIESNGYDEKNQMVMLRSAEVWSNMEKGLLAGQSDQASVQPKDPRDVSSPSKDTLKKGNGFIQQLPPRHPFQPMVKPAIQQQASSSVARVSTGHSSSVEPLPASSPFQPWASTRFEQQVHAGPESTTDERGIFMEPRPPRMTSKRQMRPKVGKKVVSHPESIAMEEVVSMEALPPKRPPPPPLTRQVRQEMSAGPRSAIDEGSMSMEPPPPRCPSKPLVRSIEEEQVFLGAESPAVKGSVSVEPPLPKHPSQPLIRPVVQERGPAGERSAAAAAAADGSIYVDLRPPSHPFKPRVNPQGEHHLTSFPESAIVEGSTSVEPLPPKLLPQSNVQQNMLLGSEGADAGKGMVPQYPKCPPQALTSTQVQKISESTAAKEGVFVELLPPRCPFQPLVRSKFQPQMTPDLVSISSQWSSPVDSVPARHTFQPWMNPKLKRKVSACLGSSAAEGSVCRDPVPPVFKSWPFPSFENVSAGSESTATQWGISVDPPVPRMPSQPQIRSRIKQPVSTGSASTSAEWSSPSEPVPPRHPFQPWVSPASEHQVPGDSESYATKGSLSMELKSPRQHPQPLMTPIVEQEVSSGAVSTSAERSSPLGPVSPSYAYQPWTSLKFEQQIFEGPGSESVAVEGGVSQDPLQPRHVSRSIVRNKVQELSSSFESAIVEESTSERSLPPKYLNQFLRRSKSQETPPCLEKMVAEEDTSEESLLSNIPSQSFVKFMAQQVFSEEMSSRLEKIVSDEDTSEESLLSNIPSQSFVKFMAQQVFSKEMSSRLEKIVAEEDTSEESLLSNTPSQSFVKFMAQQVFSESSPVQGGTYTDHLPSKSLLKPDGEPSIFSDWENSVSGGGIVLKRMPMRHPFQSMRRCEDLQEMLLCSESAPNKWGSLKGQAPSKQFSKILEKFEYQQEVSTVTDGSPAEWSSEEQLPPRHPSQALEECKFQPPILPPSSRNAPVEMNHPEETLLPSNPFQAFRSAGCQQPVFTNPMSSAPGGNMFENNLGSLALSKGLASPKKTKKPVQGSDDNIRSIPISALQHGKLAIDSTWKTPITGDTGSKEEVIQSGTGNNGHSNLLAKEPEVESFFGVRLKRIPSPHKHKNEKQDNVTQLSSLSLNPVSSSAGREQQMRRKTAQGPLGTTQNLAKVSNVAERQHSKPKTEGMTKKQPAYESPGKPPGQQSDCAFSEPAWMTMAKQIQSGYSASVPMKKPKSRRRSGVKADTKEPTYGGVSPENENQPRRLLTSSFHRQEKKAQIKPPKPAKSVPVAFEDQKIVLMSTMEKETKQSSSFPVQLQKPVEQVKPMEPEPTEPIKATDSSEPVWFSMAKKKAKAWSQIAEIMQ